LAACLTPYQHQTRTTHLHILPRPLTSTAIPTVRRANSHSTPSSTRTWTVAPWRPQCLKATLVHKCRFTSMSTWNSRIHRSSIPRDTTLSKCQTTCDLDLRYRNPSHPIPATRGALPRSEIFATMILKHRSPLLNYCTCPLSYHPAMASRAKASSPRTTPSTTETTTSALTALHLFTTILHPRSHMLKALPSGRRSLPWVLGLEVMASVQLQPKPPLNNT
jgi:hypothetical protein